MKSEFPFNTLHAPVIYGDIFDFPLTLEEIHCFCTFPMSLSELETEIEKNSEFKQFIEADNGYFFLKGRHDLVRKRKEREKDSHETWRTACRVVNFLKYIPFVKGMLVTGSLAVNNARQKDDIDFLVFVSPGRLWWVFFIMGVLQRTFSRRYLCSNYYKSIDHLDLKRKSYFLARESLQARPLFGLGYHRQFHEKNPWLFELLPNAAGYCNSSNPSSHHGPVVSKRKGLFSWLSCSVEWLFGGRLGNGVERVLRSMLEHRLHVHYGKHGHDVPEEILDHAMKEIELKFHGLDHESWIINEMKKRLDRLSPSSDARE